MLIGDYRFEPYQQNYRCGSIETWLVRFDGFELGIVSTVLEGYLVSPLIEWTDWPHTVYYDIDKVFKTKLHAAEFLYVYARFD